MTVTDLDELVAVQEEAAVAGLSHIFPQETSPFPRERILKRWQEELSDTDIAAYVTVNAKGRISGFAARRGDELLHFGTEWRTWGSGLAQWLYGELLATYPAEVTTLRLWVFADNRRARRFYEKLGWSPSGATSSSRISPHPVMMEYRLRRGKWADRRHE